MKELGNKYVTKEVLERFFRMQLINGVKDNQMFESAIELYIESKNDSKNQDVISFFSTECQ